jgi:septum formation protein
MLAVSSDWRLELTDGGSKYPGSAGADCLWLASTSPRREALLRQLDVRFELCAVSVDESPLGQEAPNDYVRRVASSKLADGVARLLDDGVGDGWVLAADTAVVADDALLGKPVNRDHALAMLAALSGRSHIVLSGVALGRLDSAATAPSAAAREPMIAISESRVWFRRLGAQERERYWATGEPEGKAGAYAIQGLGAAFVERIEGSYTGIVGLPLFETAQLLRHAGIRVGV